jgi:hypothetical protein
MVYAMVYIKLPSWSGGFCDGPLLTRDFVVPADFMKGICKSGGFYVLSKQQ